VEWAHRYDVPAIGKIDGLTADDNGLHGVVIFNDKGYDPFGWAIGQRVKAGVIRAGSVGFRVIEIEIPAKKSVMMGLVRHRPMMGPSIFLRQCLLADDDPFTGAMAADGVTTVTLGSADIADVTWKDFRDVVYKVPAEERKDCSAA
jgi:hypothetical protein